MPYFHFDLVDGKQIADEGGHCCDNEAAAKISADEIASELAIRKPELVGHGLMIAVRNDKGLEIYRASLSRRRAN